LKRLAPALREAGIEYDEGRTGHDRTKIKTLRKSQQEIVRTVRTDKEDAENGASNSAQRASEADKHDLGNSLEVDANGHLTSDADDADGESQSLSKNDRVEFEI
jgi:hypothetical protein